MTTIGLTALLSLSMRVIADSSSLSEGLARTVVAVAVCASVAAIFTLGQTRQYRATEPRRVETVGQAEAVRLLADQNPFAESRARLLALARRLETEARGY